MYTGQENNPKFCQADDIDIDVSGNVVIRLIKHVSINKITGYILTTITHQFR